MNKSQFEDIYHNQLTPKQKEVVEPLLQGLSNREIAKHLGLDSETGANTVCHRISSIRDKFNAIDKKDIIYIFNQFRPDLVSDAARIYAGIIINSFPLQMPFPDCSEALDSPFYIERENTEIRCKEILNKLGCLLRIKAPKEMGKTSLANRLVDYIVQQENYVVYYDFAEYIDSFSDIQSFFYNLSSLIAEEISDLASIELNLHSWKEKNSVTMECTKIMKQALANTDKPIALIFEGADRIFEFENIAQSFFPLLRSWHEKGKRQQIWKKLKLIISHSTEEYGILDISTSPFANVGETLELKNFSKEEVIQVFKKHNITSEHDVLPLMKLVGGHPYLIRLALYYLVKEDTTLEKLLQEAVTDSGIYKKHLNRHLQTLQNKPSLARAFKEVITSNTSIFIKDQKIKHQLEGMGLIKLKGDYATVRYELYQVYFKNRLG